MSNTTKKHSGKLFKGKMQLLLSDPFFASLMMSMNVHETDTVKTCMVDGTQIAFNPAHVESLTVDEIKATLCSAVLKVANFHDVRRNGKDLKTWQRASEIVTNQIVKDAGMKLPDNALTDDSFKGQAIEQVYRTLCGQQPDPNGSDQQQQPGNDNGNDGQQNDNSGDGDMNIQVNDNPDAKTDSQKKQQEADTKQKIAQAAMQGRKAGNMPSSIEELVKELLNPAVNWHEVLARFIVDLAKNDYSFARPNPRYLSTGFYLPVLHNLEIGKIAFFVDVSASVDVQLSKQSISEAQHAAHQINAPILLFMIDTEIHGEPLEIFPGDNPEIKIPIGGGTDFRPGFDYLKENQIDVAAVVYLTDGECYSFPDEEPDYPVLWMQYGHYEFDPPFGEVIKVSPQIEDGTIINY